MLARKTSETERDCWGLDRAGANRPKDRAKMSLMTPKYSRREFPLGEGNE